MSINTTVYSKLSIPSKNATSTSIFISYVHDNKSKVEEVCGELDQHGVHTWRDNANIELGTYWPDAIRDAIEKVDFFLAFFSKEYENRVVTYMDKELAAAADELRRRKRSRDWLIPVLLSPCTLPGIVIDAWLSWQRRSFRRRKLSDLEPINLFSDRNEGIKKLVKILDPVSKEVQADLNLLDSSLSSDRAHAIARLGERPDKRSIQPLCRALKDNDFHVRGEAALTLKEIGDPSAIPHLLLALECHSNDSASGVPQYAYDRIEAVLIHEFGQRHRDAIREACSDKNHIVRAQAIRILNKLEMMDEFRQSSYAKPRPDSSQEKE